MLTCNSGSSESRLSLWKNFREEITPLDTAVQIQKVAKFFQQTPIGTRSLDFYTPSTWPTPWEILYNGTYCPNSISLLIYYSLVLLPKFDRKVDIWLIEDSTDRFLVPVLEDQ